MKVSVRLIFFLSKSIIVPLKKRPSESLAHLSEEVSNVVKQQTKQLELMEEVHELEKKYVYNPGGKNASKSTEFEI